MYIVRLVYHSYDNGIILRFPDAISAAAYISDTLPRTVPDGDGRPVTAEIWEESEADADPKGAQPDSNEVFDYDDGAGVGQTFSP